ncbi:type II toxin-antitoxin system YoeB family toxin [Leifsonia sp. EB34]|uniref:type II toxin-antitoxin system YoeB family toxin n=1 Tax=Leifsonia sp. EB34 TaxID=3156303 RepID=UPI003513E327
MPRVQSLGWAWSRRSDEANRLVYLVDDTYAIILQARYHYWPSHSGARFMAPRETSALCEPIRLVAHCPNSAGDRLVVLDRPRQTTARLAV